LKFIRYPNIKQQHKPSVVTIGNFDGVHVGHQALINKVVELASVKGLTSVVVSMQPLASQYFLGKHKVEILTPFKCKYKLIKTLKVDMFCVLNFNKSFSELSAEEFIEKILFNGVNAKHIIIGDDFRFGKDRVGDYNYLKEYCKSSGVMVDSINTVVRNTNRVSSSLVRESLSLNQFDLVKSYLGRRYSIAGRVRKGQQLGRTLNFPTININLANKVIVLEGIFCVKVAFSNGETHLGAASIGSRPTVNGTTKILEVHILDFNKQVYGQNVEVFFYHKIRNEVKFDSLDELKRHINDDVIKTRQYFENNINNNGALREQ